MGSFFTPSGRTGKRGPHANFFFQIAQKPKTNGPPVALPANGPPVALPVNGPPVALPVNGPPVALPANGPPVALPV
jgi:hypothetical protein